MTSFRDGEIDCSFNPSVPQNRIGRTFANLNSYSKIWVYSLLHLGRIYSYLTLKLTPWGICLNCITFDSINVFNVADIKWFKVFSK